MLILGIFMGGVPTSFEGVSVRIGSVGKPRQVFNLNFITCMMCLCSSMLNSYHMIGYPYFNLKFVFNMLN